jgi:hypothetical protein
LLRSVMPITAPIDPTMALSLTMMRSAAAAIQ